MKKRLVAAVFAVSMILCSCAGGENGAEEQSASLSETSALSETTASAEDEPEKAEQFKYTVYDWGICIDKYIGGGETSVVIPAEIEGQSVYKVSDTAFRGSPVEEITFPEGVTEISSFKGASKLRKIVLPSTAEEINTIELSSLPEFECIEAAEGGKLTVSEGTLFTSDGKTLVYAFDCGDDYAVPEGTEHIGEYAFYGKEIRSISFPSTLKTIENRAFAECKKLLYVKIPSSVTEIGKSAFYNSGLIEAEFDEGVENIGSQAFRSTNIAEISLPNSVKTVGGYFVNDSCKVYAHDSIPSLYDYDVVFLNETRAEKAERLLHSIPQHINGRVRLDIDFDGIPECFDVSSYGDVSIYTFTENDTWYNTDCMESKLYHFYDKENDYDFYVTSYLSEYCNYCEIHSLIPLEDAIWNGWIGSFRNWSYTESVTLEYGTLNGHYYMEENAERPINADKYITEAMQEYELVEVIDFFKIAEENTSEAKFNILLDPIKKRSSKPLPTYEEHLKENCIEFDGVNLSKDQPELYIRSEQELIEGLRFEKVTILTVNCELDNAEVIAKYKNLKELSIYNIKDPSALAEMDSIEMLFLPILDSYDFLSEMDGVRAIQFYGTVDEPDDFFKVIKGMKNLEYFLINNYCDMPVSDGQLKWLEKNMPELKIIYMW
ncbi:MAG: leucine-rich repeat domain-containing protein [Oscillospiraceae bacterium]